MFKNYASTSRHTKIRRLQMSKSCFRIVSFWAAAGEHLVTSIIFSCPLAKGKIYICFVICFRMCSPQPKPRTLNNWSIEEDANVPLCVGVKETKRRWPAYLAWVAIFFSLPPSFLSFCNSFFCSCAIICGGVLRAVLQHQAVLHRDKRPDQTDHQQKGKNLTSKLGCLRDGPCDISWFP